MLPPDEAREWLEKALEDLTSARVLLANDPPVRDPACFHCQQTVERALKAFLVWHGVRFDRVHNLVYLLDLCERQDQGFTAVRQPAEALAPFAVEVRYPGGPPKVSAEEAAEALAAAEAVWSLVLQLLPEETHP